MVVSGHGQAAERYVQDMYVCTYNITFSSNVFIQYVHRVLGDTGEAGFQGDIQCCPLFSGVHCGFKCDCHHCRDQWPPVTNPSPLQLQQ